MNRDGETLKPYERRHERQVECEKRFEEFSALSNAGRAELANALTGCFGPEMDKRFGREIINKNLWEEALALAFHKEASVAFRASWALGWAYFSEPDSFRSYTARFLEDFLIAENPSVHRIYSKMLWDMLRRGSVALDNEQEEKIAEKSFDLLINTETKSAVRVWVAEILFELSSRLDWVAENLREVLRMQMETIPTPAILNHYGKLLRRMRE